MKKITISITTITTIGTTTANYNNDSKKWDLVCVSMRE